MSYVPSQEVEHGDLVVYTTLNQIKDNILAIYNAVGTDAVNPAACGNAEHTNHSTETEGSTLRMFHTFRWLVYGSSGTLTDPTGVGASVSLSDNPVAGQPAYYDLESIDWLEYGMMYDVSGVVYALELDLRL